MKAKKIKQKMVIIGAFILGILISIYLKTLDPNKVYISLDEKKHIEHEIQITKREINTLENFKKEYEKELKQYKGVFEDSNKTIQDLMKEELKYLKNLSGSKNVLGPGITITIKDSEKELEQNQNPNDLIVHDIDILRVVNDLKKSGAQAISINGERVVSSSQIKCSGATITVNKTTYGQPFIIKAIGDVESLMAAIISPQSYANLLKEGYGIYVKVQEENENFIKSIN